MAPDLGGIANLAVPDGTAFDTGTACALIDAAVRDATGGQAAYDMDGTLAARGAVREPLPRRLLGEPFYALPAPRTTGEELFHGGCLRDALAGFPGPPVRDVVATLPRLTARTVAGAALAVRATEVIASGGGTRDPVLMRIPAAESAGVPLRVSDGLGLPAAAKEAYAFAVLGFLAVRGLPGTVASSTGGAASECPGGGDTRAGRVPAGAAGRHATAGTAGGRAAGGS